MGLDSRSQKSIITQFIDETVFRGANKLSDDTVSDSPVAV